MLEDTTAPMERHEYPLVTAEPPEPVDYDWRARRQIFEELNSTRSNLVGLSTASDYSNASDRRHAGRPDLEETAEQPSDAQMVTIEAGHWIHENEPKRFLEVVQGFLTKPPNAALPTE